MPPPVVVAPAEDPANVAGDAPVITTSALPPLKAGRPRKWTEPAPGEEASPTVKAALKEHARYLRRYAANREAMLALSRKYYHARMERYHNAIRQNEQVKAALASF